NLQMNADKVLITIPLGVWQSPPGSEGHIMITPALPEKMNAMDKLGFGAALKIVFQFTHAFWKSPDINEKNRAGSF
ncbi:MAG TPA: FAD-dependent oxidoreductase, partial [Flavitalea sp.]|nr:FAD-dependent oxidoreductase [Flavitalea sp.]